MAIAKKDVNVHLDKNKTQQLPLLGDRFKVCVNSEN